jgi:hypothetical protein
MRLDGTPRNVVNIKEQLEDYRTVIKYARQQPELDAQRVIVFGTSFSGNNFLFKIYNVVLKIFFRRARDQTGC